jgi:hypothetical protein
MKTDMWNKRLRDWEAFDRIEMEVVPRFKTSGLSGDEWRQSVRIQFFFKGEVVYEKWVGRMDAAIMLLGREWVEQHEPIPSRVIEIERDTCDQPSCRNKAVARYKLKREFSRSGDLLDASDSTLVHYRKFCRVHLRRGDCSREDSDANYEVIDGPGPDGSTNVQESPSDVAYVLLANPGEPER